MAEEAIMATTLEKDGKEKTVTHVDDVVALKFDGWKVKQPAKKAPDKK